VSLIKVFLGLVFGVGLMGLGFLIIVGGILGSSVVGFLVGGLVFLLGVAVGIVGVRSR